METVNEWIISIVTSLWFVPVPSRTASRFSHARSLLDFNHSRTFQQMRVFEINKYNPSPEPVPVFKKQMP